MAGRDRNVAAATELGSRRCRRRSGIPAVSGRPRAARRRARRGGEVGGEVAGVRGGAEEEAVARLWVVAKGGVDGEGDPFIGQRWSGGSRRGSGGGRIRSGAAGARARQPLASGAIGQGRRSSGWSPAVIGLGRCMSEASGLSGGRSGGPPRGLGERAEARDVVGVAASLAGGRSAVGWSRDAVGGRARARPAVGQPGVHLVMSQVRVLRRGSRPVAISPMIGRQRAAGGQRPRGARRAGKDALACGHRGPPSGNLANFGRRGGISGT
uniref:Uncharacterized protein n=1 Tax=Setaria viridis TaxID=4556 RepID=A0A4U6TS28_SETVI|nr:hypothetical protein SEVIR_7G047100v2 [Setaria viridis]